MMMDGERALPRHRWHHYLLQKTNTASHRKNNTSTTNNSIANTSNTSLSKVIPDGEVAVQLGMLLKTRERRPQQNTKMQNEVKQLSALWMGLPGIPGAMKLAWNMVEIPRRSKKMNGRPPKMIHGVSRRRGGLSRTLLMHHRLILRANLFVRVVGRHGVMRHGGYPR